MGNKDRLLDAIFALIGDQKLFEEWLQTPNPSFHGKIPNKMIENEDFEPLWEMIYKVDC